MFSPWGIENIFVGTEDTIKFQSDVENAIRYYGIGSCCYGMNDFIGKVAEMKDKQEQYVTWHRWQMMDIRESINKI